MEYKYRLQYIDEDEGVTITHEFSAEISAEDMYYRIRDFLLGTAWHPETVKEIIGEN